MTDFENRDIDHTMDQFEAAVSARHIDLPQIDVGRILLALDGSNQDRAVLDFGQAVAARLEAAVLLTDASERPGSEEERSRYLAAHTDALASRGLEAHHALSPKGGRAFRQLLSLANAQRCGLIILPSPYMEDFQDLGQASVGTTTDMLLSQSEVPVLIVRKPAERVRDRLENIVLPLNLVSADAAHAAAWALTLTPEDGLARLLAVADDDALRAAGHLVGHTFDTAELGDETLAGLGQPEMAGLIAAVQRGAAEQDIDCRVSVRHGSVVATVAAFANEEPCLLVIDCGKDSAESAYQRAAALVRHSTNPVLVV